MVHFLQRGIGGVIVATTKIWDIKGRLDKVLNYASNPVKTENPDFSLEQLQSLRDVMDYTTNDFKTEKQFYVSGINCDPDIARDQMVDTKRHYEKVDGILAFHGYQSFAENETTPEIAHEIGLNLAKRMWGDRFEVLVATHLNTHCLHNHFVINSVSLMDGGKYNDCNESYRQLRKLSDEICREYGLSVIENPTRTKKSRTEWQAEKNGQQTRRGFIRDDIDRAIEQSTTPRHFWEAMEAMGYELKMNAKFPAVKPQGSTIFFRLYNLGENYTPDIINARILKNFQRKRPFYEEERKPKSYRYNGNLKARKKLTGLRVLYYHYCYVLGLLPKKPASNKRMHFLLREDLLKLDSLSAECKLLCAKKIDTIGQLTSYKSSVETKICELTQNRIALRNELKCFMRSDNEEKQVAVKSQIADISAELKKLRIEVKLCDGISTRSVKIPEAFKQIKMDEIKQREEKNSNEHIRRSGRPNR